MTNAINNKTNNLQLNGASEIYGNFGFSSSARGAVTQLTSKTTAVTINKICGVITTHDQTTSANTGYIFQVNNSLCSSNDIVLLSVQDHGGVVNYTVQPFKVSEGYFKVSFFAYGSASNAIDISFAIIKASS